MCRVELLVVNPYSVVDTSAYTLVIVATVTSHRANSRVQPNARHVTMRVGVRAMWGGSARTFPVRYWWRCTVSVDTRERRLFVWLQSQEQ